MEELLTKKSIFKQKQNIVTYEKEYGEDNKPEKYPKRIYTPIEDYTYECNLSMPLLKEHEQFYIEEDDRYMYVRQVIRTSKDNVLYYCCDNDKGDEKERDKLMLELEEESKQWELEKKKKEQEKVYVLTEPAVSEVTGFRKFIKNLFKL